MIGSNGNASAANRAWLTVALMLGSSIVGLVLTPRASAVTYFADTFDPQPLGWSFTGEWHLANESVDPCFGTPNANHPARANTPPNAFAYHIDTSPPALSGDACTYNLAAGGAPVPSGGILSSPHIDLSGSGPKVWLHLTTWRETDRVQDAMWIHVDYGQGPQLVLQLKDPPFRQTEWEPVDLDISVAAGHAGVRLNFTFYTFDALRNNHAGWYVDNVVVDDVSPMDTLTATPFDVAPASVQPWDDWIVMGGLDLVVVTNTATVGLVNVTLTGLPPRYADVDRVAAWMDDGSGFFDPFRDATVGRQYSFALDLTIALDFPVLVTATRPVRLWIVFTMSASAQAGNFIGLRLVDSSVVVFPPDVVACAGCPLDTYVPGSKTRIEPPTVDTVTVMPVDRSPLSAAPGASFVLMAELRVTVDANQARLEFVTVTLSGLPPRPQDVARVILWADLGDGVFDPESDGILSAAGPSGTVNLSAGGQPILRAVPRKFYVTLDIDGAAVAGNYVGIAFSNASSFAVSSPDLVECAGCPLDTYVPGAKTRIVASSTYQIDFTTPSWYLVSFPVELADTSVGSVLSSLAGSFSMARSYDGGSPSDPWKSYVPGRGGDLTTLGNTAGFWILITAPDALVLEGPMPSSATTIRLETGWNLVGFPSAATSYTVQDLKSATGATRVEAFSPNGPYHLQVLPDSHVMAAGNGFWVEIPGSAVDWNVPAG